MFRNPDSKLDNKSVFVKRPVPMLSRGNDIVVVELDINFPLNQFLSFIKVDELFLIVPTRSDILSFGFNPINI